MIIMGLSTFTHDTSAALVRDGKLVQFIEEERLNREKHTSKFPILAFKKCLELQKLQFNDIDIIAISQIPLNEIKDNTAHFLKYFPETLNLLKKNQDESFIKKIKVVLGLKQFLKNEFKVQKLPRIVYHEHHLCHNASAFYCSPFKESALLSIDGRGESTTTTIGFANENELSHLIEVKVPHSLGHLYAALTQYLGFKAFHDEWKVMGLSAYGTNEYVKDFEKLIILKSDGKFELDLKYFQFHTHGRNKWLSDYFIEVFGSPREPSEEILQRHKDIAFALQALVEKTGLHLAHSAFEKTKAENLCLSGGVVLNCLMNSQIVEKTKFKNFFFQPIANDAGASIGAALFEAKKQNEPQVAIKNFNIYLGTSYSENEIEETLKKYKVKFTKMNQRSIETAKLLHSGKIVAWFQGCMEAGPRALGNRSLLANPCLADMKDKINLVIKKREFFRPFAPTVISEKASVYFEMPKNIESPYMILTAKVKKDKMKQLPAVTHFDGTARVQTVTQEQNEKYYDLLTEFEKLSGVPVLLNTSFNENEPIVCDPEQALQCFLRNKIDALVMHDFLVLKTDQL